MLGSGFSVLIKFLRCAARGHGIGIGGAMAEENRGAIEAEILLHQLSRVGRLTAGRGLDAVKNHESGRISGEPQDVGGGWQGFQSTMWCGTG